MTTMRIHLLLIVLQAFIITSCGQKAVAIPSEFVETVPPTVGSDEWYPLNHSNNEFGVEIVDNKLNITRVREVIECELKILGGTLVGVDDGEWGGQLTFRPEDP